VDFLAYNTSNRGQSQLDAKAIYNYPTNYFGRRLLKTVNRLEQLRLIILGVEQNGYNR
jgi:hypothetical protein